MKIKTRKGEISFAVDEHPRETTKEHLSKLPSVFKKDGLVSAGNASVSYISPILIVDYLKGVSDGASVLVVAGQDAVHDYKLEPLVRLVGWKSVGCPPEIMGIGPVDAIRSLLKTHKLTLDDIALVEV